MIYNHGYAKAEWQREENNRVEEMRQHGMSETDIQIMIDFDLAVFNSDRRYLVHVEDIPDDISDLASCEDSEEINTVEKMLDDISNPILYKSLVEADKFTLDMLLMKIQGFTTREICMRFDIEEGVFYGRIRRLKDKIVNKL
jgi:RNA polymerase sigma-70 factor (ECF subfamily)